ncbi:uncharacterized protein SRS1_12033 [Sporisorium reilianum f. sp. reilianum]|uniref:Uncharacterized protein n=1 Tax=Sporisorium reilianum f. sp. reilianum TaxID=72559 RepID=A0A2N8U6U7_9BASI|nr:uncharacterized protein SRS1_12033 [Sporisorium reilianum f. sp. reilianum]
MSNGASFVKRSKPRSSASRISSAYDDDNEDAVAGPSSSSIRPAPAQGGATSSAASTPRRSLAGLDEVEDDDDDDAATSSVVFRARAKGARGAVVTSSPSFASRSSTGRSPASAFKQRTTASVTVEDDAGDDGDAFEIRRSAQGGPGKQARKATLGNPSLSSSTDTPKRSTPLRPTSFQDRSSDATETSSSGTSSNLYTSKYLEELRSSTPTSRSRAHSPAPLQQPTGPGTRIDDPMVTQTSRIALDDPADDTLARTKFAADFAHDGIPSESVIRAAKEKRAKLRAAASATSTSDDYISLAPFSNSSALKRYDAMEVDDGPHPHSRLQREEDELGDGEDEFAEFTGATERIPIGEKAEREWKDRQRREMEAAVRGDFDQDAVVEDEMDEDEEEWERAQLRRTQTHARASSRSASREASPFRPAPIPASAPLPSVDTCSTRLELTLRALEQSTAASTAVISSTATELETLDAAEKENKLDVAAVEDKASWFNELDEFVASLARFMNEKMAKVEEVETRALELLVKRNRMLGKRRGRWLDESLSVVLGVMPTPSAVVDLGQQGEEDQEMDTADDSVGTQAVDVSRLDNLEPADELSFSIAQRDIASTLSAIFADVQAPEYLDPAATTHTQSSLPFLSPTNPPLTDSDLHPRSVVSRFHEWRRRYPDEYAQVWGGLSVAQIWEFYARLELIPWSPFQSSSEMRAGASAIAHFGWFTGASDYTSRAGDAVGGDDEVLATLIGNVLVSRLIELVGKGAFSPWLAQQTREAVEAVDVVQTVLGAEHARCVSVVEAFLEVFRAQIARLRGIVQAPLGMQTGAGGQVDKARQQVADQLVQGLLKNLVGWSRVIGSAKDAGGSARVLTKTFVGLVESLVVEVIEPFIAGSHVSMKEVFEIVPQNIVAKSEKLSLLSHRP